MKPHVKRIAIAVSFGPLSVIATLLLFVVMFPVLFFFAAISAFAPGTGWLFQACIALIAVAASVSVAAISHRTLKSRRLAAATLVIALALQPLAVGLSVELIPRLYSGLTRKDREASAVREARRAAIRDSLEAELNRAVKQFATLRPVRYEARFPVDRWRDNPHPELGPVYDSLVFRVPVTVHEPGIYTLWFHYGAHPDSVVFPTRVLTATDTLEAGDREFVFAFAGGLFADPGMWTPATMGGTASAELYAEVDHERLIRTLFRNREASTSEVNAPTRDAESVAAEYPWRRVRVDSAVTTFPGDVRYPTTSRWSPPPKPSRLTDKQEEELRRKRAGRSTPP